MSKNLQKKFILGVLSDTSLVCKSDKIFAYEPVLRELEHLSILFHSVYWAGYLKLNKSSYGKYLLDLLEKNF